MSLHTATVAPEKLTSHQPAAVHLCGASKGIDMSYSETLREFTVGDCAGVYVTSSGHICVSFKSHLCSFGGVNATDIDENEDLVDIETLSGEQAYLLGKALLAAAKSCGVSE